MMSQQLENVIKQGYLKKGNSGGNRLSGLLRKIEGHKWFVFTIRQRIPYLEYYDNDTEVFTQHPINSYCLSQCKSVTSLGRTTPPTFIISCSDRFIELIASSRTQMLEWVNDIESSLTRLGVLQKESNEHVYSALPTKVRQPHVSQEVLEEREMMAGAAASPLTPLSINAPSSHIVDQPRMTENEINPPPLPRRPPLRTTVRKKIDVPPLIPKFEPTVTEVAAALTSPDSSESTHCSNDSDFVSWDVIMKVRESYLQKNEEEKNSIDKGFDGADEVVMRRKSKSDDKMRTSSETPSFVFDEYAQPERRKKNNSTLESEDVFDFTDFSNPVLSIGSESDTSVNMERISQKPIVEENEYSLLPGGSSNADTQKEEFKGDNERTLKPIPLPRRTFSLKFNIDEMSHLRNGVGTEKYLLNSVEDRDETKELSEVNCETLTDPFSSFLELGDFEPSDQTDLKHIDSNENVTKDENQNFDTSKNSISHSVLAPPSIPPIPPIPSRCDSLSTWTPTLSPHSKVDDDTDIGDPNFYSHPISSASIKAFIPLSSGSSQIMSIPTTDISMKKNKTVNATDSPPIPPLPLPRRKTTKPNEGALYLKNISASRNSENPPKLPPRFLPKAASLSFECPPALPSRNSRSMSLMKQRSLVSSNITESDEKNNMKGIDNGYFGAACLRGDKSATLEPSSGMRQSGLSKKMLLDRANSLHTVVSLKQTQAEILQGEIAKDHVNVTLTQKSGHGLALVDWNGVPCIAGWNQKDFPSLHGKLHIGDLLISVNNVSVASVDVAQKLLRHTTESKIELTLQRMPYAKVFAMRRNAEGQSLGLKREGGTAEILYVDPNGIAAQHGLPQYAIGTMGKSRCTWFLTEINSRPLNLFFKDNEIEHRLDAVGREISIVVQPSDFILEIRRKLKKVRNHKNFITQ